MSENQEHPIGRLLLIDDNDVDQMMYKRIIKRSGLVGETISFLYADEALGFLKRDDCPHIDAVLLDVMMPRMDGFEFLEAVRNEFGDSFKSIVVVMLTTSLNPDDRARAAKYDTVRDFLNKPLTVEHLENIAAML